MLCLPLLRPPGSGHDQTATAAGTWQQFCSQCMRVLVAGALKSCSRRANEPALRFSAYIDRSPLVSRTFLVKVHVAGAIAPRQGQQLRAQSVQHPGNCACDVAASHGLAAAPLSSASLATCAGKMGGVSSQPRRTGMRRRGLSNIGGLAVVSIGGLCALFPFPCAYGFLSGVRVALPQGLLAIRSL